MVGMTKDQADYVSYLLRLWRTSDAEDVPWRASLESPSTGQRWGFGDLEDLFEFLRGQVGHSMRDPTGPEADSDKQVETVHSAMDG